MVLFVLQHECWITQYLPRGTKIVRSFTSDTGLNDVLVHAYVCSRQ